MTVACATLLTRGVDNLAPGSYIGYIPKRRTAKMDYTSKLFTLNDQVNQLKREVKGYLDAPVWEGTVYDEDFQALPEDEADRYITRREIDTILAPEAARLAKLATERHEYIKRHF